MAVSKPERDFTEIHVLRCTQFANNSKIIVRRFFLIVRVVIIIFIIVVAVAVIAQRHCYYRRRGAATRRTIYGVQKTRIVSRPDALLCKHTTRLNGRGEREKPVSANRVQMNLQAFAIRRTQRECVCWRPLEIGYYVMNLIGEGGKVRGQNLRKKNNRRNEFKSSSYVYNKPYKTIYFHSANTHYENRVFSAKRPAVLLFSLILDHLGALFSRFKVFFSIMETKCIRDKNMLAVRKRLHFLRNFKCLQLTNYQVNGFLFFL